MKFLPILITSLVCVTGSMATKDNKHHDRTLSTPSTTSRAQTDLPSDPASIAEFERQNAVALDHLGDDFLNAMEAISDEDEAPLTEDQKKADDEALLQDLLSGKFRLGMECLAEWSDEQRVNLVRLARPIVLNQGGISPRNILSSSGHRLARELGCSYAQIRLQLLYLEVSGLWDTYSQQLDEQTQVSVEDPRP